MQRERRSTADAAGAAEHGGCSGSGGARRMQRAQRRTDRWMQRAGGGARRSTAPPASNAWVVGVDAGAEMEEATHRHPRSLSDAAACRWFPWVSTTLCCPTSSAKSGRHPRSLADAAARGGSVGVDGEVARMQQQHLVPVETMAVRCGAGRRRWSRRTSWTRGFAYGGATAAAWRRIPCRLEGYAASTAASGSPRICGTPHPGRTRPVQRGISAARGVGGRHRATHCLGEGARRRTRRGARATLQEEVMRASYVGQAWKMKRTKPAAGWRPAGRSKNIDRVMLTS